MAHLMYNNMVDNLVTRQDLALMETPASRGRFHNTYPFIQFVDSVVNEVERRDCAITQEEYAITKDGNRLFGLLAVRPSNIEVPDDWQLLVGLRGAHDQAFKRALTLGSRVVVCSNLCFHGDLGVWQTKQTTNIADRLPGMIAEAVEKIPAAAQELIVNFDQFHATRVAQDDGYLALVKLFNDGALSSAQLGRAIHEWNEPSFAEHGQDGFTAWRLFNAATQALKPTGTSGDFLTLQNRATKVHQQVSRLVH